MWWELEVRVGHQPVGYRMIDEGTVCMSEREPRVASYGTNTLRRI